MLRSQSFIIACALAACGTATLIAPVSAAVNFDSTPSSNPAAFELAANWTATQYSPLPIAGPETTPPGDDSTFFINGFTGAVTLTQPRTGLVEGGVQTEALGAMGIGGQTLDNGVPTGPENTVTTLIISADVTFTGLERSGTSSPAGEYNTTLRHIRVGLDDGTGNAYGDGITAFPWGVVKQTAGTVRLRQNVTDVSYETPLGTLDVNPQPERAELMLSSDKNLSAGSIWEVGGTASLDVPDDLRLGDRTQITSMPGAIFRVRGSQVGSVIVGDAFQVASIAGLWDADRPAEFGNRLRFNRGKSIAEFVLDAGGVTPVTVLDNLDIGSSGVVPAGPLLNATEYSYGFLRIKLSEPTTAGTGAAGSENDLVLIRADRISTRGTPLDPDQDFNDGRFFDPDHISASGGPHRPLFDSDNSFEPGVIYTVTADYAGAQYNWRIDYETSADEATITDPNDPGIVDAVVLSNLQIVGTPGDYADADSTLDVDDLTEIAAARGTAILLGSAQNKYDLNADDAVSNLDMIQWITHSGFLNSRMGDFDLDRDVDNADMAAFRAGFGMSSGATYFQGDADLDGDVDGMDYLTVQRNFGAPNPLSGINAVGVPEPGSVVMTLTAIVGLPALRRRLTCRALAKN
jgi:hypothetical protein